MLLLVAPDAGAAPAGGATGGGVMWVAMPVGATHAAKQTGPGTHAVLQELGGIRLLLLSQKLHPPGRPMCVAVSDGGPTLQPIK